MPEFRLRSKAIALTYAQAPTLSFDLIRENVNKIAQDHSLEISEWVISREKHADGELHWHAGFLFNRQLDTRDCRLFDITVAEQVYHPNVQGCRSWKKWSAYVKKDGDFEASLSTTDALDAISASSPNSFYRIVRQTYPKDYLFRKQALDYLCQQLFPPSYPVFEPTYGLDSFVNVPQQLDAYLDRLENWGADRQKSLVVSSPSRFGKTEFIRTKLGPNHIYCCNYFTLTAFEPFIAGKIYPKAYVFDDIRLDEFRAWKPWFGCQKEFTVTDKYKKKVTLKFGSVPFIWLCNPENDPFVHGDESMISYVNMNTVHIVLNNPLYQ